VHPVAAVIVAGGYIQQACQRCATVGMSEMQCQVLLATRDRVGYMRVRPVCKHAHIALQPERPTIFCVVMQTCCYKFLEIGNKKTLKSKLLLL